MLAAAAMNFKRMMNKWKLNPILFLSHLFQTIMRLIESLIDSFFQIPSFKMSF